MNVAKTAPIYSIQVRRLGSRYRAVVTVRRGLGAEEILGNTAKAIPFAAVMVWAAAIMSADDTTADPVPFPVQSVTAKGPGVRERR